MVEEKVELLSFDTYQAKALETAQYGSGNSVSYPLFGLLGEAGEIANKFKKVLRDSGGIMSQETRDDIGKEIGDVQWYLAALASDLGFKLGEIATQNLAKLADRASRGKIQGSGDNR